MSDSTSSAPDGTTRSTPSSGRSIRDWVPKFHEPVDAASEEMLRLQLNNLKLRFDSIDYTELVSDQEKKWYDRVALAFAERSKLTWDDAYRLERDRKSVV